VPVPPAKPRRPRRRQPAADANPLRRLPVKHFWVIDEGGHLRRLVFPTTWVRRAFPGDSDGPPADLPPPLKIKPRGRQRRPPKTPAGTWEDDGDLLAEVSAIVGKDSRDRKASGPAIIKELRERGGEKKPRRVKAFTKAWKNACRAAGCPGRIPHDLRRTAVRNMVRRGISETVAMQMTGHRTRSVFERYNIVSNGDLRTAAKQLSGLTAESGDTVARGR
jgi:Phage integrase family